MGKLRPRGRESPLLNTSDLPGTAERAFSGDPIQGQERTQDFSRVAWLLRASRSCPRDSSVVQASVSPTQLFPTVHERVSRMNYALTRANQVNASGSPVRGHSHLPLSSEGEMRKGKLRGEATCWNSPGQRGERLGSESRPCVPRVRMGACGCLSSNLR